MRRQNLSLQSTFPIKLYQPEEDPTCVKADQCFLCLVVIILNPEKEITDPGTECGVEPLSDGEILIRIFLFLHMSSLWNQKVNRV